MSRPAPSAATPLARPLAMIASAARDVAPDSRGRWRLARSAGAHPPTGQILAAVEDLARPRSVSLAWAAHWTTPHRYRKDPGNPVYGPDRSGAWDSWTNGVSIVP